MSDLDLALIYREKVIRAAEKLTYDLYQETKYTHSIVRQKLDVYNSDNPHPQDSQQYKFHTLDKAVSDDLHRSFFVKYERACSTLEDPFNFNQMMTDLDTYVRAINNRYQSDQDKIWKDPESWIITNHSALMMQTFLGKPFILKLEKLQDGLGIDLNQHISSQQACYLFLLNGYRASLEYAEAFEKILADRDDWRKLDEIQNVGIKVQTSTFIDAEVKDLLVLEASPVKFPPHLLFDSALENCFQKRQARTPFFEGFNEGLQNLDKIRRAIFYGQREEFLNFDLEAFKGDVKALEATVGKIKCL